MRKTLFILLLALTCFAAATIKDPRQHVKISPELSQEQVARHQALQRGQSEVGGVPEKTDDGGYLPRADNDPDAAALISSHNQGPTAEADGVLKQNGEEMQKEAEKPKRTAFGAFWAIFGGLLLAFGVWAGLNKFGPKPPEHLR
jgi:hypothetical protein